MDAAAREARFLQLYQDCRRPVLGYLFRRTDRDSAFDVAADTFLVAWRRIDDVPPGNEARLWLYGVARHQLANHRRSRSRVGSLRRKLAGVAEEPSPTPETIVIRRAEDAEMLAAVERLRPRDQELLRLATWEELPRADIAKMLGTTPQAVRQRLSRVTRRLAHDLDKAARPRPHRTTSRPEKRAS